MRHLLFLLGFCFLAISQLSAQARYLTIPLDNPEQSGTLRLENYKGSIRVTAYEGKAITVAAVPRQSASQRGNLPPLSLDYAIENRDVQLLYDYSSLIVDFTLRVPVNFSLKLKTVEEGTITVTGIHGDMEIENMTGDIVLQEVSGSASLSSIQGSIEAIFTAMDPEKPMVFTSMEGDIDLHLPEKVNANLKMKSQNGSILTDSFFVPESQTTLNKKNLYTPVPWTYGKINQGGPEILIQTYQGDILLKATDL